MINTSFRAGIGLIALLALSACATQEKPEQVADESKKCRPDETLTCDKFSGETYNCSCEKGDNLRDILDAYRMPDY